MLAPQYNNIYLTSGTTFSHKFYIKDLENVVYPMTGYTVSSSFSNSLLPASTINSTMVKSIAFGAAISDITTGEITISATAENTATYTFGRYYYTVNIANSITGDIQRVAEGILTINV